VTGCTTVSEPVSDTSSTLAQIRKHRVTHTYANNESILKLFETAQSASDFESCKLFGFASFSPAINSLLEQAERNGVELTGLYGSSELQALVAAQPTETTQGDVSVRYLSGGQLIHPEARVRTSDPETGQVLKQGESGEIEIFSPSRMVGYLDQPEATARAITADGFFKTGDLGYAVSERQFVFQTRMGDSMRLSGFLVNPAEIEQAVEQLPGVKACQVVGGTLGTKILPVAFVILKDGAQADSAGWTLACKRLMAGYKVPVRFEVVSVFPSVESANAVKIQKNKLREMADVLLATHA
jgi:fatty-acyl-CoA synthase